MCPTSNDDQERAIFLTQENLDALQRAVKEAVNDGIQAHCRLPISDKECAQVRFFFDGLRSLGDGDIHKGLDIMLDNHHWTRVRRDEITGRERDENHRFVTRYRKAFTSISNRVGTAIVLAAVALFLSILGIGIKNMLGGPPPS